MGTIGVMAYFPITFFLSRMAQNSLVYENARLYLFISIFGIIPQIATGVIMRLFLGVGRAKPIAVFSNLIVLINIILTYLLVFGKMGFPAPFARWLRDGESKEEIRDIIFSFAKRNIVPLETIQYYYDRHCSGEADLSIMLFKFYSAEIWLRTCTAA